MTRRRDGIVKEIPSRLGCCHRPRRPTRLRLQGTGRPGGKGQRPVVPREGFKKRQEVDPAWPPVRVRNASCERVSAETVCETTHKAARRNVLDVAAVAVDTSCTLRVWLVTECYCRVPAEGYRQARSGGQASRASNLPARAFTSGVPVGALLMCLCVGREGRESLQLTKIRTAAVAASGPRLGSRPPQQDGLGCAPGVIQRVSVSVCVCVCVCVSKEDSRDQMPIVECEFLRQPTVDSG
jgi:hypothetical protein